MDSYASDLMENQIAFDFDGVVHSYTSGWMGAAVIKDKPVDGIKGLFKRLKAAGKKISIFSCRAQTQAGRNAIIHWLIVNGLIDFVSEVTAEKPIAKCYVDDRAICFDGRVEELFGKIMGFKSYQEKDV